MAEIAVGSVLDKLIVLLSHEANLLTGLHSEVHSIKRELESIQCFLNEADSKAEAEGDTAINGVRVWVQHLREAAFQIEDVIDEYTLHLTQRRALRLRPRRSGFIGSLSRIGHSIIIKVKLKPRHDIASRIQNIKAEVFQLKETSERYDFASYIERGSIADDGRLSWYDPRKEALYLQEAEVVGVESSRDKLIGWLLDVESPQRTVISVVGMGGLGKTTLVKKVYDSVKEKFDCHAWIAVSQSYRMEEILKNMMEEFCDVKKESTPVEMDAMGEVKLIKMLREYLQHNKYLVIFDDVWKIDFWGVIQHALTDNKIGARIIITTRSIDVANFCKTSSFVCVHKLKPLPLEMAWELFCKKAFQFEFKGRCPVHLAEVSRRIVERCEGLPLAIVVIGGLLSTKDKTIDEWKKMHDSFSTELDSNPHLSSIMRILSFSYNYLPYYLKSCFLYLGMFPQDYSIRCVRLIRQWIAEGFVNPKEDKALETIAQEYLTELIHRSLVQVTRTDFDGRPRSCRVHDLLHEVILKKMKDICFCHHLSGSRSTTFREGSSTRRLSIVNCSKDIFQSIGTSNVRSIIVFNKNEMPCSIWMCILSSNFKLLKVLDFEDSPLDYIHEDIGNLFHLRYLSLRNTKVKMLPNSIGKLQNLEILDLKQTQVYEIPPEISNLCKLRCLMAYYCANKSVRSYILQHEGIRVDKQIGCLKTLQKLYKIDVNDKGVELLTELRNLTQLKTLGIVKLRSEDGGALCWCVENMKHLETLSISSASDEDEIIDLEDMSSSPPQFLRRLYLKGRLRKFPEWVTKLQYLVRIWILWSRLMKDDDPLKLLQNLQNLLHLVIGNDAYDGEQLHFQKAGFPKLKVLVLTDLSRLNSLVIEDGALPNLEDLTIGPSRQLKEVPFGIHYLRNLKCLSFRGMTNEFVRSTHPEEGQYYHIVQHVPRVLLVSWRDGQVETVNLRGFPLHLA